jgi:uncharacterized cofD-like protein
MQILQTLTKWLRPGIGIKRWFALQLIGVLLLVGSISIGIIDYFNITANGADVTLISLIVPFVGVVLGSVLFLFGLRSLLYGLLAPYRSKKQGQLIDELVGHHRRKKGLKVTAIGGGTGLPSVLRALKPYTSHITAVVTVADDGGSSGRLRRDMGVLPPGDLRNNIVALADDESLMAQLFQYRFTQGDLEGHAFGNLFISALSSVTGSLESALVETERVLNIQGRVFPSSLEDITLAASVYPPDSDVATFVRGESNITHVGGKIDFMCIEPDTAEAYPGSVEAILNADIVVIGPGSLYTSILPNLLVKGIAEALRATTADIVYVCNAATQPGETTSFSVADHVLAMEKHIGRGVFRVVLANNAYPSHNAGENTRYVPPAPPNHEIVQRYEVVYTDLVNTDRPWRHDPQKLAQAILALRDGDTL